MKWKAFIITEMCLFIIAGCIAGITHYWDYADKKADTRVAKGTLTCYTYHEEDGDYHSMTLVTEDGEEWEIDDYIAPLFTECEVTFRTNGTKTLEDDVITKIVTFTEMEE